MTKVTWQQFKNFITINPANYTWVQDDNSYTVSLFNGLYELVTVIATTPPSSDQIDFETNYKADGNQNLKLGVIQHLGNDDLSIMPFGMIFTATANDTTIYDYQIPFNGYMKGCKMVVSGGNVGDYLSNVEIVDKDNILGMGEGVVLGSYLNSWYVFPGMVNDVDDISVSQEFFAGLYIRITYVNVGVVAAQAMINFIGYQGV